MSVPQAPLRRLVVALALCALPPAGLAAAQPAQARDDGDRVEVRVQGVCGRGSTARLRLRAERGEIRVDTEIRTSRTGVWRLTILHERRIAARARVRATRASGGLTHRVALPDFPGADTVSVRAVAPSGETCAATATIAGPL